MNSHHKSAQNSGRRDLRGAINPEHLDYTVGFDAVIATRFGLSGGKMSNAFGHQTLPLLDLETIDDFVSKRRNNSTIFPFSVWRGSPVKASPSVPDRRLYADLERDPRNPEGVDPAVTECNVEIRSSERRHRDLIHNRFTGKRRNLGSDLELMGVASTPRGLGRAGRRDCADGPPPIVVVHVLPDLPAPRSDYA
jgi:hypothetical protein